MKKYSLTFICLVFLFSCSDNDTNANPQQEVEISITATNFLNEVLDIMETNSLNRNTIDWEDFRSQVFEVADNAQTIDEVYDSGAILRALALLGDNHSFIRRDNGDYISASPFSCQAESVNEPQTPENVGYVRIRSFSGGIDQAALDYSTEIQNTIANNDSMNVLGWIVDLRGNTGGNMWPMLAGIGPVLGQGIAGYFIGPDGEETPWGYENGGSFAGQTTIAQVENAYTLLNPNNKIAVLWDGAVASSGEAVAVSFIGRANTRIFGSSTCGLSTGNTGFSLSDGSQLLLTTVLFADRNKNSYGESLVPDVEAPNDEVIALAIDFILNNE